MINIKADVEVKKSAQKIAYDLGLPLSGVINAFLKDFIRSRSIAFSSIPHMTPALKSVLGKIETDIKKNKNMSPVFSSAQEANNYLDNL
ncbi:type II toxin-antitoxin system RelB/DinJ family antitoxin [Candidatus Azambacteria bacterium]|nr:type II toxin-antitoxin system RelB/DinJ family antitoxin [Candidatus Azambacteria bacterium]